ncbi:Hint domain-containing protein [Acetobacter cerevisiae]|uniref:Hint domain-containing protein n=1 Tax=Acetobacter cerevisiae TaxID=178900 RepID=UPI00209FA1EE|nr:Hint domain-containing protein [Acetobacter cerevisiae]MCP1270263.1 Hint domain-containing protein [Acetobacter cerevisiae]MCP1278216.1 Hint domain-containing protein [Acetobacter cerevisiae]
MTDYVNDSGVVYSIVPNIFLGIVTSYAVKITDPDGNVTNLGNIGTGQVLTKDGGALSIISILGLGGGTYVVPPGVTGSVNTVLSALSGVTVYVGGTATLGSNVVLGALSGSTINLTNGGTFSNGGGLIGLLTGSTINFGTGGGNFIANAGGALLDLSSTTIKGFDTAKDFISFENLAAAPATYSIANSSGSQVITVFDANNKKIADVTVSGQNFATGNYSSSGIGPLTVSSDGTSLSIEAVCFLSGTLLRTPDGDVAIEEVQIGDSLLAFENGKPVAQPVVWVGSRRAEVRPGLPLDEAGWPVRVRQDALAQGVPSKDLLITPEHCLYLDGQFVPARMLVNGETIAYDQTICTYT